MGGKHKKPLEAYRAKLDVDAVRKENRSLLRQLHEAENRALVAEALRASAKPTKPIRTKRPVNLHKRVATPVFLCSDWHVEETVQPETVNGLNEYTLDVAARRIARLGDGMLWMIDHHRKSFEIREALVWLGGDMMTGYIHQELLEGNALSPVQVSLWLQDQIGALLAKVASIVDSVTVVCSHGNHGRTTPKLQIATSAANSYEWLMYHQLRRTHRDYQFHIADGDFTYLKVHGVDIRFTHGDAAKYGGGIGGITVPLYKAVARWNTHRHADVTCAGHFHQLHDLPNLVVNGSLIGTSPYGMRVGSYEVPAQASFLVDSKRGKCMSTTLWVSEGKK